MATPAQKLTLELEQHIQEQIQESNQQQNIPGVLPNVLAHVYAGVTGLLGSVVGASSPQQSPPAHPGVGSAAPKGSKGSVGDDPYNPEGGYVDQLNQYIEDVYQSPNSIDAQNNLVAYIGQLVQNGHINDADVQAQLQQFAMTTNGPYMIQTLIQAAYFTGGGRAGAQNEINQLLAMFNKTPNDPVTQAMIGEVNAWNSSYLAQFDAAHDPGQNGVLIWYAPNPSGIGYQPDIEYVWDSKNANNPDNFMIMQLIGNGTSGSWDLPNPLINNLGPNPNQWFQQFMAQYRTKALDNVWNKYHNVGMLIMYFMTLYDNDYQSQEGGLGNTTNLLTSLTNNYANPMLALANQFGTLQYGPAGLGPISQFIHELMSSTIAVQGAYQTQGFANNWMNNVFKNIMNIPITVDGYATQPLSNFINRFLATPNDPSVQTMIVDAFNSLNPAPSGQSPSYNPGFQSMLSGLQSGGGLITGTSKMINTQLSTVSSLDSQDIKLGSSLAASDGGGIMQMILAIINNFASR